MTSNRSAQLYTDAALELERAAAHYREAAKHTDLAEHVKAAHHAHISRGHFLNAQACAHEAAKIHAEQFSKQVMEAHPVTDAPSDYPG